MKIPQECGVDPPLGDGRGQEMQENSCLQRGRRGPWQRRFFYGRRTSARGGPKEGSSGGLELPLRCSIGIPPLCRQLLSYITKDKQTESLLEKLCQRFRTARYAAFLGGGGGGGSLC